MKPGYRIGALCTFGLPRLLICFRAKCMTLTCDIDVVFSVLKNQSPDECQILQILDCMTSHENISKLIA